MIEHTLQTATLAEAADEADEFGARPGADRAVQLRLWDDLAKTAGAPTPGLDHFLARAGRCTLR